MEIQPSAPVLFHLAFPVTNIPETKAYYCQGLGCTAGRENAQSVILNLYGHQLVAHVSHEPLTSQRGIYPRHFGLVFTALSDWEALLERAKQKQLQFYQEEKLRFPDTSLEHRTFFLEDPFHNLMEFKFYSHSTAIFGDRQFNQIGDLVAPSSAQ
jgi:uncharacterized protein